MAKSWQYPRSRKILLQVTMWVILAGTVGLAALLNRHYDQAQNTPLTDLQSFNHLSMRIPAGWQASGTRSDAQSIIVDLEEPRSDSGRGGRRLRVTRRRLGFPLPPQMLLEQRVTALGLGGERWTVEAISVDGCPGMLIPMSLSEIIADPNGNPQQAVRKMVTACAVAPTGVVIEVQLNGPGHHTGGDVRLVRQVAESIRINENPRPMENVGQIALAGGVSLTVPDHLSMLPADDPLLSRRRLINFDSNQTWVSVDVTPAILPPGDATAAIHSMLATMHVGWLSAHVEAAGERTWHVRSTDSMLRQTHISVVADSSGQAVILAVTSANDSMISDTMQKLESAVRFDGKLDYPELVREGAAAVAGIAKTGLSAALAPTLKGEQIVQWWLWRDGGGKRTHGWSYVAYHPADPLKQSTRRTRWRNDDGLTARVAWSWNTADSLAEYESAIEVDAASDVDAPWNNYLRQQMSVSEQTVTASLAFDRTTAKKTDARPAEFLPGGWAPALLGQMTVRPMILRTDAFLLTEWSAIIEPMMLLVVPEEVAEMPADAHRCVRVTPNGSGESLRLYYAREGNLVRVETVDKTIGTLVRERDIRAEFGIDPQLSPIPQD